MRSSLRSPRRRSLQRGLTLVELMVALTLGLVVAAALLLLFANASANGQNLQRASSQIETGRYVSELLREDLRLAGFFGETSVTGAVYSTPDPCLTSPTGWSGLPYTLPAPVQGYLPTDDLGCLTDRYRKAGTSAIVVRRVSVDTTDPATIVTGNTQYYVQYSFCNLDVSTPRLIFSATSAALVLRNRACTASNTLRAHVSRIYYIASCNKCGTGGDTTPTLKRLDLVGNELVTTALAEGIETLSFEYGFDDNNDGSADTYLTTLGSTATTSVWTNVMAIKLHFITRSLDRAVGSNLATAQKFQLGGTGIVETAADGYSRRAYSSVIRLVNPSGVREAQ